MVIHVPNAIKTSDKTIASRGNNVFEEEILIKGYLGPFERAKIVSVTVELLKLEIKPHLMLEFGRSFLDLNIDRFLHFGPDLNATFSGDPAYLWWLSA